MEETETPQAPSQKSSNKGMMIVVAVVVILLIAGGAVAYTMSQKKTDNSMVKEESTQMTNENPTTTEESTDSMTSEQKIVVSGKNFSFSPSTIKVKKGQKVTIVFKDVEGFHDFRVDELNVKTPVIQTGKEAETTFTPTKTGTFEFYCSVGNHRAMGMKGTLIVE